MANEGEHGGFEDVRESVDGHPMANLLAYARPYWRRLTVGSSPLYSRDSAGSFRPSWSAWR